ncbi:MAG: 50S ribosomal protein L30 [Gammaproteobacteria bacterium]|nr:50S ribosomal protein L30 [Gammaproteobacteria bacterium]
MAKKDDSMKGGAKKIRVTLLRSSAGQLAMHQNNVRGLGLRRRHHSVELDATPAVLGMVRQSAFMLKVEEI